jgi:hypothetical protein
MNKTGKIILGIVAGVAIFAVGVQYSNQVMIYVDKFKDKVSGGGLKKLKDKISNDLMLQSMPAKSSSISVFAVGLHEDTNGQFIRITVKDETAKGEVQKYLMKNKIENKPIKIVIGEMAKAQ